MRSDERAIQQVHDRWIGAVNAGDAATLLDSMTDDAVFLHPGVEPFGRAALSERFAAAHRHAYLRCISTIEEVAVVSDVAWTRCSDSLRVTPRAGGETAQLAGHRITIYRRQPDGRWLLARDANTLSPIDK